MANDENNKLSPDTDSGADKAGSSLNGTANKKLLIGFAAMGIVIIILLIVVIIVLVSGKKKDDSGSEDGASSSSSSQSSEDSSGDSGDGSSDSITDASKVADDSTSSDSKSDSEKETTKVEKLSKGLYLAYSVGNTWEDGDKKMSGLALNIVNNTDSDI